MRWSLILMLCGGCHLIIDPDDHVSDSVDASADVGNDGGNDAGNDAGSDAAADVGADAAPDAECGELPPSTGGPPCCWDDDDCPTDGPELVCHGGMCGGQPGVCYPPTPNDTTGSTCFLDTDCASLSCLAGPNCGCRVMCDVMAPMPGACM